MLQAMSKVSERDSVFIYGRHAVLEAVEKRPEIILRLFVRLDIINDSKTKNILEGFEVETFQGSQVPRGVDRNATHQGWIAEIDATKLLTPFKKFKSELTDTAGGAIVVLGEIQDPHNVGAIIRSAAAFGCRAVLVPEHRGCPISGTVIKTSVGTAFTMPLVSVTNINNALRDLKDLGYWVYGLDGDGDVSLHEEQFTKPPVFVVGNEATGMRAKTHEVCDTILSIPMSEKAESLNASVSAAVVLYQWSTYNLK